MMVRVPCCTPPLGVPSAADLIREGIVVNLIRRERAAMPAELERRCLVAISHPSWCPGPIIALGSRTAFAIAMVKLAGDSHGPSTRAI